MSKYLYFTILFLTLIFGNVSSPLSNSQAAAMARYVVHTSDWVSVTFNILNGSMFGYPGTRILSMSDGIPTNSSGIPYFLATELDDGIKTLTKDNRCSISMSLAQTDYCKNANLDPENPCCAQVSLTGKFKTIENGTEESQIAHDALWPRHPEMEFWISVAGHNFKFRKLEIEKIFILYKYGGASDVSLSQYFNAEPSQFVCKIFDSSINFYDINTTDVE